MTSTKQKVDNLKKNNDELKAAANGASDGKIQQVKQKIAAVNRYTTERKFASTRILALKKSRFKAVDNPLF